MWDFLGSDSSPPLSSPSARSTYCGTQSSVSFLTPNKDDVSQCYRGPVYALPFIAYLGWWGLGRWFLTRKQHAPSPKRIWWPGWVDFVRYLLITLLAVEAPIMLILRRRPIDPHDYVDALVFGGFIQWAFIGWMLWDEVQRARHDSSVVKIATLLALGDKAMTVRSVLWLPAAKDDYGVDYELERTYAIFIFSFVATTCFFFVCVARDWRTLRRQRRAYANERMPQLSEGTAFLSSPLLATAVTPALRTHRILPGEDEDEDEDHIAPVQDAGLWSRLTFAWMNPLIQLGYKRPLVESDIYPVQERDRAEILAEALSSVSQAHSESNAASPRILLSALYKSGIISPFLWAGPLKLLFDSLAFLAPDLLHRMITFLTESAEEGERPKFDLNNQGLRIALAMFLIAAFQTFVLHAYFNLVFRSAMRVRAALISIIFKKLLRLSSSARSAPPLVEKRAKLLSKLDKGAACVTVYLRFDPAETTKLRFDESDPEMSNAQIIELGSIQKPNGTTMSWDGPREGKPVDRLFRLKIRSAKARYHFYFTTASEMAEWSDLIGKAQSRAVASSAEIMNLLSTDAQKMQDLLPYLHVAWSAPFQIIVCLVLLWGQLEWATLVALGTMIFLLFFVTGSIQSKVSALQGRVMKAKDDRVRASNELLSLVKSIKLAGWDSLFKQRVESARNTELQLMYKYAVLRLVTQTLFFGTPVIVTLVTFSSFVLMGGHLDAATTFTALTLLTMLRFPLAFAPEQLAAVQEGWIALRRIQTFLSLPELSSAHLRSSGGLSRRNSLDETHVSNIPRVPSTNDAFRHELMSPYPVFPVAGAAPPSARGGPAIELIAGTFFWDDARTIPALHDVHLKIQQGETVMVVGKVGSGKSALLLAMLGELVPSLGEPSVPYVSVNGSVSFAAQSPWIRNASVRDNILFGEPMDDAWYSRVVHACALESDFQQFPDGDSTEIGERGTSISGGQKARISLARAIYSKSDILFLESCFEAVDEHVGAHIWKYAFQDVLRDETVSSTGKARTVILVSHSFKKFSADLDRVVVMEAGSIAYQGPPSGITPNTALHNQLYQGDIRKSSPSPTALEVSEQPIAREKAEPVKSKGTQGNASKIMTQENNGQGGSVSLDVYSRYVHAMGGKLYAVVAFVAMVLATLSDLLTTRWLAHWSHQPDSGSNFGYYIGIFSGLSLGSVLFSAASAFVITFCCLQASKTLHTLLLESVTRAKMIFFETTPLGRIVNRFTRDISILDSTLPGTILDLSQCFFNVIGTFAVCALVTPPFLLVMPVIAIVYALVQRYYVRSSRELKRLESISVSPVFSVFGESLEGATSIRAYRAVDRFVDTVHAQLNKNLAAYFCSVSTNRWLAVRLETLANVVLLAAAALIASRAGQIDPSLAGMSLTYVLSVTQTLNWCVRMVSDLETNIVSVERVDDYSSLEAEAPEEIPAIDGELKLADWPSEGRVEFRKVSVRYRPELPFVLNGLEFEVRPGEHVGIAGRTGAGKSSVFVTLLRIVEPTIGSVWLDGVDVSKIGLRALRNSVAMVQQDPFAFRASLRFNLDPIGVRTDAELWNALRDCELETFVKQLPGGLDAPISEGGSNISFGQRQLLQIARALLRNAHIVLLDEATSAIDRSTDALIQSMIARVFSARTTLTIAHRLETILSSDRVLVMDAGRVAEFDEPSILLQKPGSIFAALVREHQAASTG